MEKGDKRCAVIQAAMELVAEHGFHGAPMALVAERAGVAGEPSTATSRARTPSSSRRSAIWKNTSGPR